MKTNEMTVEERAADEVAGMTATEAPKGVSEAEITEKVRAGLTRKQAIEVITNQQQHDAALAKAAKAKK